MDFKYKGYKFELQFKENDFSVELIEDRTYNFENSKEIRLSSFFNLLDTLIFQYEKSKSKESYCTIYNNSEECKWHKKDKNVCKDCAYKKEIKI